MWVVAPLWVIGEKCITIQKRGFAGIAFLNDDHLNADELRLVLYHFNKAGMRDLHERLIVPFADLNLLLPKRVLADDNRANPFSDQ